MGREQCSLLKANHITAVVYRTNLEWQSPDGAVIRLVGEVSIYMYECSRQGTKVIDLPAEWRDSLVKISGRNHGVHSWGYKLVWRRGSYR